MTEDYYTRGEKEFLLKISRQTIEKFLQSGEKFEPRTANQKLWEKCGSFVTLKNNGKLRGCIGLIEPVESLILAVRDNAISALRDPRFAPVEASEIPKLIIEISIISPLEEISLEKIERGMGVVLEGGFNKATFLPQVWKDLPDKNEFLSALAQKAGLPPNGYQDDSVKFSFYQAVVFSEKDFDF